ncbi:MAG: hypothetical protein MK135_00835 [Polyangiaceae bacterium]|nr:hypothetical protein [Polyangiaceae bacterium]
MGGLGSSGDTSTGAESSMGGVNSSSVGGGSSSGGSGGGVDEPQDLPEPLLGDCEGIDEQPFSVFSLSDLDAAQGFDLGVPAAIDSRQQYALVGASNGAYLATLVRGESGYGVAVRELPETGPPGDIYILPASGGGSIEVGRMKGGNLQLYGASDNRLTRWEVGLDGGGAPVSNEGSSALSEVCNVGDGSIRLARYALDVRSDS